MAGARELPADQFLSLNLSPPTLEASEFSSGALLAILARYAFPPERLIVELTERQQLYDLDRARSRLEACRRAGIRFAADDIGAGNAGLRLLAEIRFDVLKVDLTLVQRSAEGPSSAVLGSVVELASRTGALVIAEGIEHAASSRSSQRSASRPARATSSGAPEQIEARATRPEATLVGVADWRQSIGLPVVS